MEKEHINQFARCDGYNPSVKVDNPILEKWIHKEIVKKTGDTEDDFIIEQKAVCIDKINIQKSIQEEAKTTDLKYLLTQLLLQNGPGYKITGDEPELNQRQGFYGDITSIQQSMNTGDRIVSPEELKASLPEELQSLSAETLAKLTDQEILDYIAKVREKSSQEQVEPVTEKVTEKGGE